MTVVAIVAILASVAMPSYLESVRRSNRAEAIATMLEAANWLQRGYTVNNTYVGATTATLQARWVGSVAQIRCAKYNITLTAAKTTATDYELVATPAKADKCGTFLLDETGKRTLSGNTATVDDCWGGR